MTGMTAHETRPQEFSTFVRNRYFYGKLLDVFHFELETDYMNAKRSMLNRVVTGWGVVCGLDVRTVKNGSHIIVTPGLALDKWGREIVVPTESHPVCLPQDDDWRDRKSHNANGHEHPERQESDSPEQRDEKGKRPDEREPRDYHVMICYHECQTGSMPILTGDCGEEVLCTPGTIEERYRIEIRPGHLDPVSTWDCRIPDAITRGELRYEVLVDWVTNSCPEIPADPCVPLANIRLRGERGGRYCETRDIDITIRTLALSNRALFYLLMSMLNELEPRSRR